MRYPGGERPAQHFYGRKCLSPNDYRIIAALKVRGAYGEYQPIKQADLAKMTGLQQSKVSKTLDRLCFKGIVSRFRYSYRDDALKLLIYFHTWSHYIVNHVVLKQ